MGTEEKRKLLTGFLNLFSPRNSPVDKVVPSAETDDRKLSKQDCADSLRVQSTRPPIRRSIHKYVGKDNVVVHTATQSPSDDDTDKAPAPTHQKSPPMQIKTNCPFSMGGEQRKRNVKSLLGKKISDSLLKWHQNPSSSLTLNETPLPSPTSECMPLDVTVVSEPATPPALAERVHAAFFTERTSKRPSQTSTTSFSPGIIQPFASPSTPLLIPATPGSVQEEGYFNRRLHRRKAVNFSQDDFAKISGTSPSRPRRGGVPDFASGAVPPTRHERHRSISADYKFGEKQRHNRHARRPGLITKVHAIRETHVIYSKNCSGEGGQVNQYSISVELGEGSYGKVYKCTNIDTGVDYALKKLCKRKLRKKMYFRIKQGMKRPPLPQLQVHSQSQPSLSATGLYSRSWGKVTPAPPEHAPSCPSVEQDFMSEVKREIAILKKISNHRNIATLVEVLDDVNGDALYIGN
jgi:hypothetical protein